MMICPRWMIPTNAAVRPPFTVNLTRPLPFWRAMRLLTLAFETLSDRDTHSDPHVRIELVRKLAIASGGHGMVGGQMLDLIGEREEFDLGTISRMQRMKTGHLFAFACESGAILGKADDQHKKALCNYAYDLGLAFQVTDDVLDVEADPEDTGKPANQDEKAGKSTFVSTMGKERQKCAPKCWSIRPFATSTSSMAAPKCSKNWRYMC